MTSLLLAFILLSGIGNIQVFARAIDGSAMLHSNSITSRGYMLLPRDDPPKAPPAEGELTRIDLLQLRRRHIYVNFYREYRTRPNHDALIELSRKYNLPVEAATSSSTPSQAIKDLDRELAERRKYWRSWINHHITLWEAAPDDKKRDYSTRIEEGKFQMSIGEDPPLLNDLAIATFPSKDIPSDLFRSSRLPFTW